MSRRLRERSRTWFSNQVTNKEEEVVTVQHVQRYEILLKRCCCFFILILLFAASQSPGGFLIKNANFLFPTVIATIVFNKA